MARGKRHDRAIRDAAEAALVAGQSIDAVADKNGIAVASDAYDLRRIGTTDFLYPLRTSGPLVVTYTAGYGTAVATHACDRRG